MLKWHGEKDFFQLKSTTTTDTLLVQKSSELYNVWNIFNPNTPE